MIDPFLRLRSLRVRDVMTTHVIDVEVHQPIEHAALLLKQNDMSAAPVVDEQGRCVGILSASDLLARKCEPVSDSATEPHLEASNHDDHALHIDAEPSELVCHYMTSAVQTIPAAAPVLDAAQIMMIEHIHRLPVLDEQGRPQGMISTMDIVAATMNVMQEASMRPSNPMKSAMNYVQSRTKE